MAWTNGALILYHGTDDRGSTPILIPSPPRAHGVKLANCATLTDFGPGFYTTTSLNQARNWANNRYRRSQAAGSPVKHAVVLQFDVDRGILATLASLGFVVEGSGPDYWDFITHCRNGIGSHLYRPSKTGHYDLVCGPISLWPQNLVIKDCDQFSFHTDHALDLLPKPTVIRSGNPFIK